MTETKMKKSKTPTENVYFKKWQSPIGGLYIYANNSALLALTYSPQKIQALEKSNPLINETIQQLKEYFSGERKKFTLPLAPIGTDFQRRAWNTLKQIPYGKTISYKDQANQMRALKAFRAVGTANSKNPIAIIIPCHRVIASSGKISGYAGGVEVKSQLLKVEGISF
jgi:methylated-DNA-[protein]-cysteine S-methyltransferase